jgi:glucose/galactose transporter
MTLGLLVMAAGALLFIPAARERDYGLFLLGLFVQATGLTILQTAANPYMTILGPIESAAKRMSIMGICNKVAGAIAPLILIHAITKTPDEIDHLFKLLPTLSAADRNVVLDELAGRLVVPYLVIAVVLVILCFIIRLSRLPDVEDEDLSGDDPSGRKSIFRFPYLLFGAVAVFCGVSVEVLAIDSIINYGQYAGFSFRGAKFFATYTLVFMLLSYLFGMVAIPKLVSQKKVLQYSAVLGLVLSALAICIAGKWSVWCISFLGIANAMLWPSLWPLSIEGLGRFTKQGSALLIMVVTGAALVPLLYGYLSDYIDPRRAYVVLIPCYLFILFFAVKGHTIGKTFEKL